MPDDVRFVSGRLRLAGRLDWILLILLACVAVWGIWQAQRVLRADFISMRARFEVDEWMAGRVQWSVPEWIEARNSLLDARALTPDNPVVFDYLGVLNAMRGEMGWRNEGVRKAYFQQALAYQQMSLRLRWHNGAAWGNLALSQYALGDHPSALQSLDSALRYGPNELRVKHLREELVLAMWSEASAKQRAWVQAEFAQASEGDQKLMQGMSQRYGVVIPGATTQGVSLQP